MTYSQATAFHPELGQRRQPLSLNASVAPDFFVLFCSLGAKIGFAKLTYDLLDGDGIAIPDQLCKPLDEALPRTLLWRNLVGASLKPYHEPDNAGQHDRIVTPAF